MQAGAVIFAKDLKKISEFYKQVIGFEVSDVNEAFVKLQKGAFELVVLQIPKHVAARIEVGIPPLRRENTPIKLVFFVKSLGGMGEMVKELGGELNSRDKEWEFDNHIVCDGCDPEGNVFQLRAPHG